MSNRSTQISKHVKLEHTTATLLDPMRLATLVTSLPHIRVLDKDRNVPPRNPAQGDAYLVSAPGIATWLNKGNQIAVWTGTEWGFIQAAAGWRVWTVDDELELLFDGTTWLPANGLLVSASADVAINSTSDVTIVTRDVANVRAGDKLIVEGQFTIVSNDTTPGNRFFDVTLDFDGLFDSEIRTATYNASSTAHRPHFIRGILDVRSASDARMDWTLETQLAAGLASGADTSMAANHLRGVGRGTTASDVTGTCTVALKIRSDGTAATQTCQLHSFTIRKDRPV